MKQNQLVSKIETKSDTNLRSLILIQECIDLKISDTVMTSQERNNFRARRSKRTQSLKHSFKRVFVSHAQLAHSSTLAKEKHMLLILNFSTLIFITNARTTMPFARLHFQMVCTQSEPAEIPHVFVQILVQVGGDRKRRTSRTTFRTPTLLVIRHCFLVYCART